MVHTNPPANPATSPVNPANPPANPATSPANPANPPAIPATSPANPATSPVNPATSPVNPATSPANPATSPANPATSPANPATSPVIPATSPANPATSPANPATSPANPATSPVIPAKAGIQGAGGDPPATDALGFLGDLLEDVVVHRRSGVRTDTDTPCAILRRRGGSAANAAVAAAGVLGPGRVRFFGQVGADPLGDRLLDELAGGGVEPCVRRDGRTGTVVVLVGEAGERTMLTDRGACAELDGFERAWLDDLAILHVAGYSLLEDPSATAARRMIGAVRGAGGTVSVDACSVGAIADAGVVAFRETLTEVVPDVLLCDAGEARLLESTGGYRQLAGLVIVKDGARPTRLYGEEFDGESIAPPHLEDVPDTTGAGDTFAGGLLAARLEGCTWREATEAGQAAAAAHLESLAELGGAMQTAE